MDVSGWLRALLGGLHEWLAHASGSELIAVAGATWVAGYLVSIWLHPYTRCGACKGSPRHYGAIFTRSFRLCAACGGSGRQRRWGAKIFRSQSE